MATRNVAKLPGAIVVGCGCSIHLTENPPVTETLLADSTKSVLPLLSIVNVFSRTTSWFTVPKLNEPPFKFGSRTEAIGPFTFPATLKLNTGSLPSVVAKVMSPENVPMTSVRKRTRNVSDTPGSNVVGKLLVSSKWAGTETIPKLRSALPVFAT